MDTSNENDKEELIVPPLPPPYESIPPSHHLQQQSPPTIIVNNTTVVQVTAPVEIFDNENFCRDTPRPVRRVFIRNLFFLIAAQFFLIAGIIAVIIYVPQIHDQMKDKRNSTSFYITWFVSMICLAIISFWERARRIPPANYVTVIVFTFFQGITLGCAATYESISLILLTSVGNTVLQCTVTALFELQGRFHLGNFRSLLFVWTANLICFAVSLSYLDLTAAGIAAVLSTIFGTSLVVNAQMMVHGTTRYVLTPKEYIFGAMNIYVDIVHAILLCVGGVTFCACSCCQIFTK